MYRSIDSLRKHSGYIAMQQSVTRQQITSWAFSCVYTCAGIICIITGVYFSAG
jgi:hypothetical protein